MDDLVYHCLRELSFDGNLGSNVSRLKDFIIDFYVQPGAPHAQNTDDVFCTFIWSLVVQQQTVRVGTVPKGLKTGVWIAPQTSKAKKTKKDETEPIEMKPFELDLIPDAKFRTLESLIQEFGDRLRIAVEPNAIYAAITGSHIRFAKLSPMVYSALQVITRGRDDGVSVVALGKQTGYDQKSCFYLIKQLQELNLVVKVPKPGIGSNFVIHRYFFDKNPHWRAIREEENKAEEEDKITRESYEEALEEESSTEKTVLDFTPIDARHLSSLPLVRSRVVKLLKASKNHIHESNNMLITIGFSNPTKIDRRFFQNRIRELLQQGIIERVEVPSLRKKASTAMAKCLRLVTPDKQQPEGVASETQSDEEIKRQEKEDLTKEFNGIKMNSTLHKQIFDLLQGSGTRGMTLSDISAALCNFDKRIIELLLARADKTLPPSHLSDLGIVSLMETSGRERHHRYYTVTSYHQLIVREDLDPETAGGVQVNFESVGEFNNVNSNLFYEDGEASAQYQNTYKVTTASSAGKRKATKNPDASIKKHSTKQIGDGAPPGTCSKRKFDDIGAASVSQSPHKKRRQEEDKIESAAPKRRGRPPKNKSAVPVGLVASTSESIFTKNGNNISSALSVPKKRGRPSKRKQISPRLESPPRKSKCRRREEQTDVGISMVEINSSVDKHTVYSGASTSKPARETSSAQIGTSDNNERGQSLAGEKPGIPSVNRDPLMQEEFSNMCSNGRDMSTDPTLILVESEKQGDFVSRVIFVTSRSELSFTVQLPSTTDEQSSNVKTTIKGRVNVSNLRREAEIFRVIESFSGIVHIQSKEFTNAHITLLESMAKAGEPTSAPPGTKTDKRTAMATLDALEARGKIKQLRTSIQTHIGVQRAARIAYLPYISQEQLKTYLADLAKKNLQPVPQSGPTVKINKLVEYGTDPTVIMSRTVPPLQLLQPGMDKKERWSKNRIRANQLFAYDDDAIREVLLAERTTLSQLYGLIVGKMARVRELHLLILRAFELDQISANLSYCSLICCLVNNNELLEFYLTDTGKEALVHDLPPQLHSLLQIGRSRARSRFLEMLEVLRLLGIVTPLRISEAERPLIICTQGRQDPLKFGPASLEDWTTSTPMTAPSFWKLNRIAPIYVWHDSETNPPFWKDMPVNTLALAIQYWDTLRIASCETSVCLDGESSTGIPTTTLVNVGLARSLRRSRSWKTQYAMTWHQMQYLRQFIDIHVAKTPLDEFDSTKKEELLSRVCRVTTATKDAVVDFYEGLREKLLRESDKVREREKRLTGVDKCVRRVAEVKELLAKKAAEARRKRDREWDALLLRVHPGPLSSAASGRVKRVQKQFLQASSTQDTEKWERDVLTAVHEADMAQLFKVSNGPLIAQIPLLSAQIVLNPLEPSVEDLIRRQGTPAEPQGPLDKRKREKKEKGKEAAGIVSKKSRRHRFQWTRDYDELARDAAAIIRARCRNASRIDWAAFEQVFPVVPRNNVRQRVAHIREAPGNETYMNRLEEKWLELWVQHRGTHALPDDDPQSTSNFDLIAHIVFLRKNIDKNALRVGYDHEKESGNLIIPSTIETLLEDYEVDTTESPGLTWDFMWNANVAEGREKGFVRQPFSQTLEIIPTAIETTTCSVALAEAALKMTLGTPAERYDTNQGVTILKSVGQKNVESAAKSMIARGILSKLKRDPLKSIPGRHLKISDMNLNTIGGSIPKETFQDAVSLEEVIAQSDDVWQKWPLTATDGDCVTLIELVMESKVGVCFTATKFSSHDYSKLDFKLDTSQVRIERVALDWNSKKADDDQIETSISYRRAVVSSAVRTAHDTQGDPDEPFPDGDSDVSVEHGLAEDGQPAGCILLSGENSLIDCKPCLTKRMLELEMSARGQFGVLPRVLRAIHDTGKDGITPLMLQSSLGISRAEMLAAIQELSKATVPLVYWTGYESLTLITAPFIKHWSITISEIPLQRIFPRRWLDTEGRKIAEFWEAALRSVLGLVVFRPGISQKEIIWRMRSTYDRQEVHDLLRYLSAEGFLKVQIANEQVASQDAIVRPLSDVDERCVFYFTGDRRWYQV